MDADATALKSVEALYNLTKAAYDAEISRYDATEAKAGRYVTLLGLIIGAFVVKFDAALWVWDSASRWVAILFVVAYAVTLFSAAAALALSVFAMSIKEVSAIPVGEEIENLFRNDYKAALEMTTVSFRSATRKYRDTTDERLGYVEHANRLIKISMVAGAISLLVYLPLRLSAHDALQKREEPKMSDTAKPNTAKPATTNTTQAIKKPAAIAKPPEFDLVKRDIGPLRKK
jgi:hypothetical protein